MHGMFRLFGSVPPNLQANLLSRLIDLHSNLNLSRVEDFAQQVACLYREPLTFMNVHAAPHLLRAFQKTLDSQGQQHSTLKVFRLVRREARYYGLLAVTIRRVQLSSRCSTKLQPLFPEASLHQLDMAKLVSKSLLRWLRVDFQVWRQAGTCLSDVETHI